MINLGSIYSPLNLKDVYEKRHKVLLEGESQDEDAFFVTEVDQEEVNDIFLIQGAIDKLKWFGEVCQAGMTIGRELFLETEEILISMVFFTTKTDEKNPFTCEGIPIRKRQKLLREMHFAEVLVDILFYPFANELYLLKDIDQNSPITRICQLSYRMLKHITKNYKQNEMYISQWMDLFFDQAMKTGDENDLYAEATLTELLNNNKQLLDKQINKETIKKFIDLCISEDRHARFITFLTALCSCNGEPVSTNQNDICEIIFQSEEVC